MSDEPLPVWHSNCQSCASPTPTDKLRVLSVDDGDEPRWLCPACFTNPPIIDAKPTADG